MGLVLAVALVAVAFMPAASATSHRVRLALVALPNSALGAAGRGLALSGLSGVVSNTQVSLWGHGISSVSENAAAVKITATLKRLGRITGYELTYGDPYSGRRGVAGISTGVERYRTSVGAERGLGFWQKDDSKMTLLKRFGLAVRVAALKAATVGTRRFAQGMTYTVPHAAQVSLVDEQFSDGPYVLHAEVAARSIPTAAHLTAKLARALERRLRRAEAGHLRGQPVALPPRFEADGPPAGGPDLATLALTNSDLAGRGRIIDHGYNGRTSPPVLSVYTLDASFLAAHNAVSQTLDWFTTANDATVLGRFIGAEYAYNFVQEYALGQPGKFASVDLHAAGDHAFGGFVSVRPSGLPTFRVAVVVLSSGRTADVLVVNGAPTKVRPGDLANLAQTAAKRLNTGLNSH